MYQDKPGNSRLLLLADELVLSIIERIDDIETLRDTALACRRLQVLVEPFIYEKICINAGHEVRKLQKALHVRPQRALGVRELTVRYKAQFRSGIEHLDVGAFRGLRSLHIESPCPNDGQWPRVTFQGHGRTEYWLFINQLASLRSLHIHTHFHGRDFFDLARGQGSVMFDSPSLRHIHLACANITPGSLNPIINTTVQTPLQSLVFEECNIAAPELKVILSKPKALKSLILGERRYHNHDSPTVPLVEQGAAFWDALSCQRDSLQYFKQTESPRHHELLYGFATGHTAGYRHLLAKSANKTIFTRLEEVDLPQDSALLSFLEENQPGLHKVRIHDVIDPPITRIKFFLDLPKIIQSQQDVKHVEIVLEETMTRREHTTDQWMHALLSEENPRRPFRDAESRGVIWHTAKELAARGVRLTINWIRSAGYIPPYMHGEILPTEFNIYDSNRRDIFGNYESGNCFRDSECEVRLRAAELLEELDAEWVDVVDHDADPVMAIDLE